MKKGKVSSLFDFHAHMAVKFHDDIELSDKDIDLFFRQNYFSHWNHFLQSFPGIRMKRLFDSVSRHALYDLVSRARQINSSPRFPNFNSYYIITCPPWISPAELMPELMGCRDSIELAYRIGDPAPPPTVYAANNPLSRHQLYLNASRYGGVDAKYAWKFKGGDGTGKVKFVDIEQGWIMDHQDIRAKSFADTGLNYEPYADHGAAVLGVIMMKDNKVGGVGITPNVNGYVISQWRPDGINNIADAILLAVDKLVYGDVLLLEAQVCDEDSEKFWPPETEDAIFHAIRLATASGIIVIEAAGNGNADFDVGNDLDEFRIHGKKVLNPSDSAVRDSGAILVAAASAKKPHVRIKYSNYGSRINCFASGENVVTAGSYPALSSGAPDTYTKSFCGTSSAAAIIAGAAIAIQSIAEANAGFRLSPATMRNILSDDHLGTSSANGRSTDKIGVMPDLKKIIHHVLPKLPFDQKT